jgi:hypothetical protein
MLKLVYRMQRMNIVSINLIKEHTSIATLFSHSCGLRQLKSSIDRGRLTERISTGEYLKNATMFPYLEFENEMLKSHWSTEQCEHANNITDTYP